MRHSLGSEIGLAHFGVETKHETKPNLPNLADKFVVVGDNKPILVVQLVISDHAFAQRDLLRSLDFRLNQIHNFLDEIIIWIFIFDDLISRLINLI